MAILVTILTMSSFPSIMSFMISSKSFPHSSLLSQVDHSIDAIVCFAFSSRDLCVRDTQSFEKFSLVSLLLKVIYKTLCISPTEVSGWKCLKLGFSEFLSLLYLLPLRNRCTSTTDFRNIGVKSWVLILETLGVKTLSHPSVVYIQW